MAMRGAITLQVHGFKPIYKPDFFMPTVWDIRTKVGSPAKPFFPQTDPSLGGMFLRDRAMV